jgi:hypothetical protein
MYRCDSQAKGVSLAGSSLVEKASSNLALTSSRSFLWSQGFPRVIQHALQKLDRFGGATNSRRSHQTSSQIKHQTKLAIPKAATIPK